MSLRKHSTIKIGGEVERLLSLEDLRLKPEILDDLPRPFRLLGNGSNTLIDDRGLKGTAILCREKQVSIESLDENESAKIIRLSAGSYLPSLAKSLAREGWSGTEYMVGVPGTLGGAVVQNAGANEQEMKDILVALDAIDLKSGSWRRFTAEECQLAYRHSRFKDDKQYLISSVELKLRRAPVEDCMKRLDKNLQYRKLKTPFHMPSLGSMYTRLRSDSGEEIFPGAQIEAAGLKGHRIGDAMISDLHANYFVNLGNASFDDVFSLMKFAEERVYQNSGVRLVREVDLWSDRY